MIKKYHQFILENRNIEETNEGLKDWVAAFLLLANVGVVPLNITTANAQTKKQFVEKQPQDKIDAAKFVEYINKVNSGDINKMWTSFITQNKDIKSQFKDVEKYINKDGKVYHFDKKYQQQDFSNVDIHNFTPHNYLTDMGGFIDDSQEPSINNFIYDYERQTSVEICVLTVPSLDGEDPFEYSLKEFNRLGVGKDASDNGILIMVSMQDRKWQIRTGYGVEGLLPDITCSHIGDNMKTHFKQKDYYGGIMEALKEIKSNIDKSPEEIKQMKKRQDDKESADFNELMTNIGFGALALAMITTLIILVYRKWKNASEMMGEVSTKMKAIEKMKSSIKVSNVDEVDNLYNKFKDIINKHMLILSKVSKSEEKPKFYQVGKHADFLMNQKKRIESLEGIYDDIANAYNIWSEKKNRLNQIQSTISGFNLSGIISSIDIGFRAWNELKTKYGVDLNYDPETLKSKASELTEIINKVDKAYRTSLSEAENIISTFNSRSSQISSSISGVQSRLSTYKTADDKVKNWRRLVDSSLSDMNRYKNWARSSEKSEIESLISSFERKIESSSKSDLLKSASEIDKVVSTIEDMKRKWKRRKEEEEEEERRKKRKDVRRDKRKKRREEGEILTQVQVHQVAEAHLVGLVEEVQVVEELVEIGNHL